MNCPRCKFEIPEDVGYCTNCGSRPEPKKRLNDLTPEERAIIKRRRNKLMAVTSAIIIVALVLLAYSYSAGWWTAALDSSKVYVTDFYFDVDGVSDCTAILRYVLHNDNPTSAGVHLKYFDHGVEVASDFLIVGANKFRHVTYYIEYVDCLANHSYEARVIAVS